jgi:hypothetical protein
MPPSAFFLDGIEGPAPAGRARAVATGVWERRAYA